MYRVHGSQLKESQQFDASHVRVAITGANFVAFNF